MAATKPTGLCECGCGQPTKIGIKNDRRQGMVKGQPQRFIFGHSSRLQRRPATTEQHSCECGCGEITALTARGHSRRFVNGHHARGRVRVSGYRQVAHDGGIRLVHRVRAEAALGHPLPPAAEIHHPDRDPQNPNARLVICPNRAYHKLLHTRMRIKAAGGNPNTDKICGACRALLPRTVFTTNRSNSDGLNRLCRACCSQVNRRNRERRADCQAQYDIHP